MECIERRMKCAESEHLYLSDAAVLAVLFLIFLSWPLLVYLLVSTVVRNSSRSTHKPLLTVSLLGMASPPPLLPLILLFCQF